MPAEPSAVLAEVSDVPREATRRGPWTHRPETPREATLKGWNSWHSETRRASGGSSSQQCWDAHNAPLQSNVQIKIFTKHSVGQPPNAFKHSSAYMLWLLPKLTGVNSEVMNWKSGARQVGETHHLYVLTHCIDILTKQWTIFCCRSGLSASPFRACKSHVLPTRRVIELFIEQTLWQYKAKRRSPRSQRSLNSGLMCSKLGGSQSLTRLQWTRLQIANSACCFSLIFGKLRTTIKIHFTLARPALASSNSTWLQVVEKTFWKQKYWRRATCFLTCFLQFCNWNSYETPCPKNPSTFQNCKHSKLGSVRLHQWLSA